MALVAQENNYRDEVLSAPSYKYIRKNPLESGNYTLSTSQTEANLEFTGSDVYNMSPTYVTFNILLTAPGADGTFLHILVGKLPIDRSEVVNSTGFVLATCQTVDIMSGFLPYAVTSKEEFLSRQPIYSASDLTNAVLRTGHFCQPAKVLVNTAMGPHTPNVQYIRSDGDPSGTGLSVDAGQISQLAGQMILSGGNNVAVQFSAKIYLKDLLPHTICSENKDRYFGPNINTLKLWFSSYLKLGTESTSQTNPATNASDLNAGVTITNLRLNIAVEKNSDLVNKAINAFNRSDVSIVPYLYEKSQTIANTTSGTIQRQLSSGDGHNLLRVYTCAALANNSGRLSCNLENVNGYKVASIQTQLDSALLQDRFLTVADGDHWNYISKFLNNCALQDARDHAVHWFHVDQIASASDSSKWLEEDLMESGYPLESNQVVYQAQVTTPGNVNLTLYSYYVIQRHLKVGPEGFMWV